jgi:hypothetical protein
LRPRSSRGSFSFAAAREAFRQLLATAS